MDSAEVAALLWEELEAEMLQHRNVLETRALPEDGEGFCPNVLH